MNILLIGNGFDLAHGLKTEYSDFLKFISDFKPTKNSDNIYEHYDKFYYNFFNFLDNNSIDVVSFKRKIEENTLLKFFIKNYEELIKEGKDTWIDFEKEIKDIIMGINTLICKNKDNSFDIVKDNKGKIMSEIKMQLKTNHYTDNINVLKEHTTSLEKSLDELIFCINIYFSYLMEEINKKIVSSSSDIKNIDCDCLLSFNYTNTYEILYDFNHTIDYCYIHGKIDLHNLDENNRLVLGFDEISEKDNTEYIYFKKYFQRIYKKTGNKYKNWLEDINKKGNSTENNLYIFGHSLNETDKDILNELITNQYITTTIFYHDNKAFRNQITNLVKIIGKDELIRKTGGTKPTLIFKEQQPMTITQDSKELQTV